MTRYLLTHSLLSAWLYAMKENPYADATNEQDPMEDFLRTLRREPSEPNEAMQRGIDFEAMVTDLVADKYVSGAWYPCAKEVADIVRGGVLQLVAQKTVVIDGCPLLLYGRLDALKGGTIYDIKFSGSYDVGKYLTSSQHPMYFELVPEARQFEYLISNGSSVWRETYTRDETQSVIWLAADFLRWLRATGNYETYQEKWLAL